jgi:PadR family transcriptional regulator PadR
VDENSHGVLTIKEGTLYPLLHQLEKKGFITGTWQKIGSERAMKVYELTDNGRHLLDHERDIWGKKATAAENILFSRRLGGGLA